MTPPELTQIDPQAQPPLSLYQGPWTIALAIAFVFRGKGAYYIDDIDNAGVRRGAAETGFGVVRKEIMSKTGWTNCRPLTAFCPDGFLFANLSSADYPALDEIVPLAQMARHRATTVSGLIRDTSRTHGIWSLAGPDRAIVGTAIQDAGPAIVEIIGRHEDAITRTVIRPADRERALRRLRYLMPGPRDGQSLSSYFQDCLGRGIALAGGDAPVLSAAHDLVPAAGGRLFSLFADGKAEVIAAYNAAASIQGSQKLTNHNRLPYYAVGLGHGERIGLSGTGPGPRPGQDQIIAPKILVLEDAVRMALPLLASRDRSVLARKHAYRELDTGSSQVFFDSTWLEAFAGCRTEVAVDPLFLALPGLGPVMPLGELTHALLAHAASDAPDADMDVLWARWALAETLQDLRLWHYPVLAYAIGGDAWLGQLALRGYFAYAY